jgi:hypothetical protein
MYKHRILGQSKGVLLICGCAKPCFHVRDVQRNETGLNFYSQPTMSRNERSTDIHLLVIMSFLSWLQPEGL